MKNNKKTIALTTSFLLLFVFGSFLFPIVNATETYTTIEEIEDFSCVDDTYIYSGTSDNQNFGDSPLLLVGYDSNYTLDTKYYFALFKFDLSNKPENCIKAEIIPTFKTYSGYIIIIPFLLHNNWNEVMTYEEFYELSEPSELTILPFSTDYDMSIGEFIHVVYSIDIFEYIEQESISFALWCLPPHSKDPEDISTVYSKEYPAESVRPKIIWTVEHEVEHEIIILQNNEIPFLLAGLFIGLIVGLVVVGVVIVLNKKFSLTLNKRKSKI